MAASIFSEGGKGKYSHVVSETTQKSMRRTYDVFSFCLSKMLPACYYRRRLICRLGIDRLVFGVPDNTCLSLRHDTGKTGVVEHRRQQVWNLGRTHQNVRSSDVWNTLLLSQPIFSPSCLGLGRSN